MEGFVLTQLPYWKTDGEKFPCIKIGRILVYQFKEIQM